MSDEERSLTGEGLREALLHQADDENLSAPFRRGIEFAVSYMDAWDSAPDDDHVKRRFIAALAAPSRDAGLRVTHGRHCPCSACARQDWTDPTLAHCGMHGPDCPAVYEPLTADGVNRADSEAE